MPALDPELKSILRWLRKEHPLDKVVRVWISPKMPSDALGFFDDVKGWYSIRIAPGMPLIEQREILLHEWAHGLTNAHQDMARSKMDHDSIFTHAYQDLVMAFEEAFPHLKLRRHRVAG